MSLALAMIFAMLGAVLSFCAFVIASNPGDGTEEKSAETRGTMVLLGDFLLVVLDSLPLLSIIFSIRELPATTRMMRERCRAKPLIRRLLVAGSGFFLAAGICLWAMTW